MQEKALWVLRAHCPPDAMLSDFAVGKLDPENAETVGRHLDTCADCRERVAGISSDSFVGRLRQVAAGAKDVGDVSGDTQACVSTSMDSTLTERGDARAITPRSGRAPQNLPPELANNPDFEVIKELGRGGMGTVYLAKNRIMDRLEVLKVVNRELLARPGTLERFQREIRAAARLSHPNVVAAYSVVQRGGLMVLAMEYVAGEDLAQVVKRRGPLPVAHAAFYAHQVALGLEHAFERGMVHRDIKPGNLLLSIEGKKHVLKILDFGLAKAASEKAAEARLTKTGQMLGTPDFVAPEQTLAAHKADIRADIYSLGCTLYYLLSGRAPFTARNLYEIIEAHHSREAQALNLVRPEVPRELAAVVAKMMAKDPAKRYQTPLEVAKTLVRFFKPGGGNAAPRGDDGYPKYAFESVQAQSATPPSLDDPASPAFPQPVAPALAPIAAVRAAVPVPTARNDSRINIHIDTHRSRATTRSRWSSLPPWQRRVASGVAAAAVCLGVTVIVRNQQGEEQARLESRQGASVEVKLGERHTPDQAPPSALPGAGDVADSAVQQWLKRVRSLSAEQQIEAVVEKLKEINPGFDGQVTYQAENGIVTELTLSPATLDKVKDISPLGALAGLQSLTCHGALTFEQGGRYNKTVGDLSDLSSLAGLRLSRLDCSLTNVPDLAPLSGMPLTDLNISTTRVLDLSPLVGMSLTSLNCFGTSIKDLSPLKGMPITNLICSFTQVRDLSPLTGMPLTALQCINTPVFDLSPLKGAPLTNLSCMTSDVSDLSPLRGMALTTLLMAQTRVSNLEPLAGMPLEFLNLSLTSVDDLSPLADMPLKHLWLQSTKVTDLSPLAKSPLEALWCDVEPERDAAVLRSIKTLTKINNKPVDEFWKEFEKKP